MKEKKKLFKKNHAVPDEVQAADEVVAVELSTAEESQIESADKQEITATAEVKPTVYAKPVSPASAKPAQVVKPAAKELVIDEETAKILAEVAEFEKNEQRFEDIANTVDCRQVKEDQPVGKVAVDFFAKVEHECPNRISATKEEKLGARIIRDGCYEALTVPARMEPFYARPLAGRQGATVYAAIFLLALILYFVFAPAAIVITGLLAAMLITQFYFNKDTFNKLFPRKTSYNVVTAVEHGGESGGKTVILGSNYDNDYGRMQLLGWVKNREVAKKIADVLNVYTYASIFILFIFSIVKFILTLTTEIYKSGFSGARAVMFVIPFALSMVGIVYLVSLVVYPKRFAKEGRSALSGVSVGLAALKYFEGNGNLLPKNSKVMLVAFGSSCSGQKGASAFIKQHADDGLLDNAVFIQLDNMLVGDYKIINYDKPLNVKYDEKLSGIVKEVCDSLEINAELTHAYLPTAATIFQEAGVPSTCLTRVAKTAEKKAKVFDNADAESELVVNIVKKAVESNIE